MANCYINMENDEILEPKLEQTNEGQEEEVNEETPASEENDNEVQEELAKAKAEAAKYRRLLEKAQKPKVETQPQQSSPSNVEETVLLAQGMPEELLGELKVISQMRKVSLIKTQADPIFVAVKDKFEKDLKQKEASLPASRGSGQAKPKVSLSTPNLSREEHKRLAMEAMS